MFIDINKIDEQGESLDHELKLDDLDDDGGVKMPVARARLTGRVEKAPHGAVVEARVEATVRRACGRCLEVFEASVSTEFTLALVPELPSPSDPTAAAAAQSDGDLFEAPEGKADLELMATEQIYLSLPIKPVCRKDCKGLCPGCGANRNVVGECGCRAENDDPRLGPLRELKDRLAQSSAGL